MWVSRQRPSSTEQARHREPLGPLVRVIDAPPETVFDVVAGPYLGKTPRALEAKMHVVERGSDLVVADHFTPIFAGRLIATTRETVGFERPHRITFRLLSGPVAAVAEEYLLDPEGEGQTRFTYRGELGSNLPVLGGQWAARNARIWNAVVRHSLEEIAAEAERRSGGRAAGQPAGGGSPAGTA